MVAVSFDTIGTDHSWERIPEEDRAPLDADLHAILNSGRILLDSEARGSESCALAPRQAAPLRQDRAMLFARIDPWLNRQMRRYRFSAEARQDSYGELYFHFCALLDRYEPDRGVPLMAYLYRQLSAYLYTSARGHWRRQRREVPLFDPEGAEISAVAADDPTHDWDERLMIDQLRTLLPMALRQMPPRQRRVLTWRYYHELSFEEIASRMCIQTATARSLLRHGLNSVRDWMRQRKMLPD